MREQYQVIGHAAHASVQFPDGRQGRQMFFKGQMLPPTATPEEIRHLLSVGLIRKLDSQPTPEAAPQGAAEVAAASSQPDPDGHGNSGDGEAEAGDGGSEAGDGGAESPPAAEQADPDVEAKRAEARSKLPTDGSKPDGRMGQPVWVEWLVSKGYDYAELAKQDRKDLVELANKLDQ